MTDEKPSTTLTGAYICEGFRDPNASGPLYPATPARYRCKRCGAETDKPLRVAFASGQLPDGWEWGMDGRGEWHRCDSQREIIGQAIAILPWDSKE